MPTKKGKSKPAKARKTSNKMRRGRPAGGKGKSARVGGVRKAGAARRGTARKRSAGKLKRTEAGPVWIGSSPTPVARPTEERGDQKAGDGRLDRVVIL